MKRIFIICFVTFFFLSVSAVCVWAHNPFTAKPNQHHMAPKPIIKSTFFVKIIFWQQQLREKISGLIRETKTTKKITPILVLVVISFAYGIIHSAGPGHGKAVALSYILSCKPSLPQGLAFGNMVALTHGLSGILLVLAVKFILQTSITGSLEAMTLITQRISFSLILILGLIIFSRSLYKWVKKNPDTLPSQSRLFANPFITAIAVGMIPCPGVVMVMLFSISLDMTWLGIILGTAISFGMATTITVIVFAGMSGKAVILSLMSKNTKTLSRIEYSIEAVAGLLVAGMGLLFLNSTF